MIDIFGRMTPVEVSFSSVEKMQKHRTLFGGVSNKMAKEVIGLIKLQLPAGKANPAPPVGPALGQHGVNIMEFCKAFNAKHKIKQDGLFQQKFLFTMIDLSHLF